MAQAFEYRFKMQNMHKVSASVAGEVCQQLSVSPGGLTPKRLVDVSRNENAPLHNEFEWDDTIAGEKYREGQAQQLIQHLIIVKSDVQTERHLKVEEACSGGEEQDDKEDDEVEHVDRGFVSTGEHNTRYVPLMSALTNEIWRANLLDAAKRDSHIFISKYNRLSELASVIKDMKNFLDA